MRNTLKVLAVAAMLLPGLAMAQVVRNTKHDLSNSSTASVKTVDSTVSGGQICIFCHTPHFANQQALIWNHVQTSSTAGFTALNTVQGTPLPSNVYAPGTKRCMDCHDATVALGQVSNYGGGVAGTFNMTNGTSTSTALTIPSRSQVGPSLNNNHPVGIPYAGQASYNGVTSGTGPGDIGVAGGYFAGSVTGCINASNVCTTQNVNIELVRPLAGTGYGIECVSCHEPHNRYGFSYLLRATAVGSGICLGCHNK